MTHLTGYAGRQAATQLLIGFRMRALLPGEADPMLWMQRHGIMVNIAG
jgi:hypothetical protein